MRVRAQLATPPRVREVARASVRRSRGWCRPRDRGQDEFPEEGPRAGERGGGEGTRSHHDGRDVRRRRDGGVALQRRVALRAGRARGRGRHATRATRVLPDLSTLPEIRFDPRDPNEAHVAVPVVGAGGRAQKHAAAATAARRRSWTSSPRRTARGPRRLRRRHGAAGRRGRAAPLRPGRVSDRVRHRAPGDVRERWRGDAAAASRAESALDVGASGAAMPGDTENDTENDTALANAAGLDLFDALRIAARSAHNRAVLASHGVLDELALTLQLATRRQNALAADVSAVVSAGGTTTSANAAARAEATRARARAAARLGAHRGRAPRGTRGSGGTRRALGVAAMTNRRVDATRARRPR